MVNLGKKVRKDYGIMTFDHSELLETFNINLTSINNNVEEIGRQAGNIMAVSYTHLDVYKRQP